MRTATGPELTILNAADRVVVPRLQVQNASGTWKTLSGLSGTGFANLDFVLGLQWGRSNDDATWTGSVRLAGAIQTSPTTKVSLATYMETSPANVDDASAPAPLIEGMRRIRWFTTTKNINGDAATEHKVFDGYVVEVDDSDDEVSCTVSDLGHRLVQAQVESEIIYPAGQLLEAVIQQMLDNTLGAGEVTLDVDPGIAGLVVLSSAYAPGRPRLMEGIRNLALQTVGANACYVWDGEDMVFRLFMPPRSKTVADFTYAKSRMYPQANFVEKTDDVRNVGTIRYQDADKKAVVAKTYSVPASVAKYGRRYFEFDFDATSQINTEPEATTYITTAIDDLAQPKAEQRYTAPYNWAADVYDLYTLTGNDVHYSSDQSQAVARVGHTIGAGGEATTAFETRGNIAGFNRRWIAVEGPGASAPKDDIMAVGLGMAQESSMYGGELFDGKPDGCVWPYLFIGKTIKRVHIWGRLNKPGTLVPQWPPTGSDIYKAVTLQRPEGRTPREGNFTFPPGTTMDGADVSGKRVWRVIVPIPTNPNSIRTIIERAEGENGTFGKEQRYAQPATDINPADDPAGYATVSIVRVDATTVRLDWLPTLGLGAATLVFRDGVNIDQVLDDGTAKTYLDEELHADKGYLYQLCRLRNGLSGPRTIVSIDPWTASLAFSAPPDFFMLAGKPRVRIQAPTGVPVGTAKIRIQKSVDSGHYDPWTTVTEIPVGSFPYYDAVVFAGQFYQLQALDSGGVILDTSQPSYWTNPG
jgi:hypothetical protein